MQKHQSTQSAKARHTAMVCALCTKSVHEKCPRCENEFEELSCPILLHRNKTARHQHCFALHCQQLSMMSQDILAPATYANVCSNGK